MDCAAYLPRELKTSYHKIEKISEKRETEPTQPVAVGTFSNEVNQNLQDFKSMRIADEKEIMDKKINTTEKKLDNMFR